MKENRAKKSWSPAEIVLAIVLIVCLGGLMWTVLNALRPQESISPAPEGGEERFAISKVTKEDLLSEEWQARLKKYGVEFNSGSMPTTKRIFADAVSTPLTVTDELKELFEQFSKTTSDTERAKLVDMINEAAQGHEAEMFDAICESVLLNPVMTDMLAKGLAGLKVAGEKGKTLAELNPWIKDYVKFMDEAYAEKSKENNKEHAGMGISALLKKTADGKIIMNDYQLEVGASLLLLMEQFQQLGVGRYECKDHFALNVVADPFMVRTEKVDYIEDLPVYRLAATRKSEKTKAFVVIGFNLFDQRLEIFRPLGEEKPKPTTEAYVETTVAYVETTTAYVEPTTQPTTQPTTEATTQWTTQYTTQWTTAYTTADRTTQWTTADTTDGNGTKNPNADAAENGNGPVGGGPNSYGDGDGDYDPTPDVYPPNEVDPVLTVTEMPQIGQGNNILTEEDEIVPGDNVEAPATLPIPVQPEESAIAGEGANEGEVTDP